MLNVKKNKTVLSGSHAFSPEQTFLCGQCFRFEETGGVFSGIAGGRYIEVAKDGENTVLHCSAADFEGFWHNFFDLSRDYSGIISSVAHDPFLRLAAAYGGGIRILRQEPWEALCSFIISQCNNIPRIKGIIRSLCELCGDRTPNGFTFPPAERVAMLEPETLSALRAGYRAPYLSIAARAVVSGALDLDGLSESGVSTAALREKLMELRGVGQKVADCVLLYGFGRGDAFPVDVWMKKALSSVYPSGFDYSAYGENAGIIQQYIFYYAREHEGIFPGGDCALDEKQPAARKKA